MLMSPVHIHHRLLSGTLFALQMLAALLPMASARPGSVLDRDQEWCSKELGLQGDCIGHFRCLCVCYEMEATPPQVSAAYFGELGYDLALMTPFQYYLHERGMLNNTVGPIGSTPWVYFSKNHTEVQYPRINCDGPPTKPKTFGYNDFDFHDWSPPHYKEHFSSQALTFEKPHMIIHNKFAKEWGNDPINFIDVPTLLKLAKMLTPKYTIIYIRPAHQHLSKDTGYADDGATGEKAPDMDDHAQLKAAFPEVIQFHELLKEHPGLGWNDLLVKVHAKSDKIISVFGGNAYIASYFAGTNILLIKDHRDDPLLHFLQHLAPPGGVVEEVESWEELLARTQKVYL